MVLGVLSSPLQALFTRMTGGAPAEGSKGIASALPGILGTAMLGGGGDLFQMALLNPDLASKFLPKALPQLAQLMQNPAQLLSPLARQKPSLEKQMGTWVEHNAEKSLDRPSGPRKMDPGTTGPLNANAPLTKLQSKDEIKAVEKTNKTAGDAMDVKGGALTQQTQGRIQGERARTEKEKYNFSEKNEKAAEDMAPKANKKRLESNEKHQKKANEIGEEMAKVAQDPKLLKDPKKMEKKLTELQKKMDGELKCIRPPFTLAGVTRQVDDIMNDKSLSAKEKSKQVDQIRKDYGLPKRGDGSMSKVVTGPLSKVYKESAKRLDGLGKEIEKAGEERMKSVEKAYGKGSPEAKAAKKTVEADIKSAKLAQKKEHDDVKAKGDQLGNLYPSPWKKFLNIIGGILGAIGSVMKLFPGIGTIAGTLTGLVGGRLQIAAGNKVGGAITMGMALVPIPGAGAIASGVAKGATFIAAKAAAAGGAAGTAVAQGATFVATKAGELAAKAAAPAAAGTTDAAREAAIATAREGGTKEAMKYSVKEGGKEGAKSAAKSEAKGYATDLAKEKFTEYRASSSSSASELPLDQQSPAFAFVNAMQRKG
jgi:hypothetical protein